MPPARLVPGELMLISMITTGASIGTRNRIGHRVDADPVINA